MKSTIFDAVVYITGFTAIQLVIHIPDKEVMIGNVIMISAGLIIYTIFTVGEAVIKAMKKEE
jgi:biotin transporter BioY